MPDVPPWTDHGVVHHPRDGVFTPPPKFRGRAIGIRRGIFITPFSTNSDLNGINGQKTRFAQSPLIPIICTHLFPSLFSPTKATALTLPS